MAFSSSRVLSFHNKNVLIKVVIKGQKWTKKGRYREEVCFGLRMHSVTIWSLLPPLGNSQPGKTPSTFLFLQCFHWQSYHRPQLSPLLDSFTFHFLFSCSQITSSLFFSQFVISSSAPQLNAVQICGNSSKQLLLKYAEIYVNCPCWLCIAFLYSFAMSSKLVLTQPKSASNVLTLTCFSWLCALFRMQFWRLQTSLSLHIYRGCFKTASLRKLWLNDDRHVLCFCSRCCSLTFSWAKQHAIYDF